MLTGTLDDFTLADVLRLVAGARRTGDLAVTRDGGAGTLRFRDGAVSGAVPRYERRHPAASPAGAVEDLAFDLMRWGRGEFTWTPGASPPAGPETAVDVDDLLREVTRRLDELAQIRTLVPSEDAVLAMAPQPPEGAVQINITPAEWRVLVLVDGHRTAAGVAAAAGLDDLEGMRLLYGLAAAGLVAATRSADDAAEPPPPVSDDAPEEDDAPEAAIEPEAPAPEEAAHPEAPAPEAAIEPEAPAPEPAIEADASESETPAEAEEPDPFLAELAAEPASPFDTVPPAPHEAPAVDRSTAARELAGLFDDVDAPPGFERMAVAASPRPPAAPRRVEDDDQVTRGLISRLIDGVKGL
ncbi:MAG TPA: DUF4388 domain-containing protein [Actinomycetota bacterium]|nr:DUF4388 domain-containing protein [Actinomycetota bacterium]